MKNYKKILSVVTILTLCTLMVLTSIPFASAVSKPKPPTNLAYDCPFAIDGAELLFKKPSGGAAGYRIQVKDYNGKKKYNKSFGSATLTKIKSGHYKNYYYIKSAKINKIIKAGQWYTIRMQSYNLTQEKTKFYSDWSGKTYAACDVSGLKAKRSGTTVKITWSMNGVAKKDSKYLLDITKNGKTKEIKVSGKTEVNLGISKSIKKLNVFIVAYKKVSGKWYVSDSTNAYHTVPIK